jgi:hypothetical protein
MTEAQSFPENEHISQEELAETGAYITKLALKYGIEDPEALVKAAGIYAQLKVKAKQPIEESPTA